MIKTKPTLHFRIVSPKRVLFENDALSVSSTNIKGHFDILPGHANFLTIIENSPLKIKTSGDQDLTFDIPFGVIYNVDNQVNIYTDIQSS